MKFSLVTILISILNIISFHLSAQTARKDTSVHAKNMKNLYLDVHQLEPGKVKYEAVAEAHKKDLAVQNKYGVKFIKYWVDEYKGVV